MIIRKLFSLSRLLLIRSMSSTLLPYFAEGVVCKGFGRGSKELGIPTANFDHHVIDKLPQELDCGIYFGFANVDRGPVYKAVLSIGWNPFYKNDKKSVETYLMHEFESDFYGSHLKLVILDHIRPEKDFDSLEALIAEIKNDCRIANERLDLDKYKDYQSHNFFHLMEGAGINGTD